MFTDNAFMQGWFRFQVRTMLIRLRSMVLVSTDRRLQ